MTCGGFGCETRPGGEVRCRLLSSVVESRFPSHSLFLLKNEMLAQKPRGLARASLSTRLADRACVHSCYCTAPVPCLGLTNVWLDCSLVHRMDAAAAVSKKAARCAALRTRHRASLKVGCAPLWQDKG